MKGSYAGIVRMSASDLICDVELTIRKVLAPAEQEFFWKIFVMQDNVFEADQICSNGKEEIEALKFDIQNRLAIRFKDVGIYPTWLYMQSVDARQATKGKRV